MVNGPPNILWAPDQSGYERLSRQLRTMGRDVKVIHDKAPYSASDNFPSDGHGYLNHFPDDFLVVSGAPTPIKSMFLAYQLAMVKEGQILRSVLELCDAYQEDPKGHIYRPFDCAPDDPITIFRWWIAQMERINLDDGIGQLAWLKAAELWQEALGQQCEPCSLLKYVDMQSQLPA